MKKVLKLLVAIILAIAIIGLVMFLVDCSLLKSEKKPIFARETAVHKDGGTIEYLGIGYKIIDFNKLNGYDETKIGLWNIKYGDYENEYSLFDENLENENQNTEKVESGDVISGDVELLPIPSGEILSGDEVILNKESGEKIEAVIKSGDDALVKEEGYYFNATIIGVNKNNLIVQALENDPITASSDMFSFRVKENEKEFLIGQKVRIKYTGTIMETYPAQIDVIGIEIIE